MSSASVPLLSAALIVKDEEELIADCLTSLRDGCDEIVVYDTGSVDRTRAIAHDLGARVVEGYWDDSFAAARNRSLAECTGEWVLVVDADERLEDGDGLRDFLLAAGEDAYLVAIDSPQAGRTVRSSLCRLFRRSAGTYAGRLHEQVVDPETGIPLPATSQAPLRLLHLGYEPELVAKRGKVERNLRLAESGSAESGNSSTSLAALGRAQLAAGDAEAALGTVERVQPGSAPGVKEAAEVGVIAALALHRGPAACDWLARLSTSGEEQAIVRFYEAAVLAEEERFAEGLDALDDAPVGGRDPLLPREPLRLRLLSGAGRLAEAAEFALDAIRAGRPPATLDEILALLEKAGVALDDLAQAVPDALVQPLVVEALSLDIATAEPFYAALHERSPADRRPLAAIANRAAELPVLAALEWSVQLRAVGLHDNCPLVAVARSEDRGPRDRLLAAALAAEAFADPRAHELLDDLAAAIPDEIAGAVLGELHVLAPGVAARFEVADVDAH